MRLHPAALALALLGLLLVIPVAAVVPFVGPIAGVALLLAGFRLRGAYTDPRTRALGTASIAVGAFVLVLGVWFLVDAAVGSPA
jgi:hypothetical protein